MPPEFDSDRHPTTPCAYAGCPSNAVACRQRSRLAGNGDIDPDLVIGQDTDQSVPLCLVHFRELATT